MKEIIRNFLCTVSHLVSFVIQIQIQPVLGFSLANLLRDVKTERTLLVHCCPCKDTPTITMKAPEATPGPYAVCLEGSLHSTPDQYTVRF